MDMNMDSTVLLVLVDVLGAVFVFDCMAAGISGFSGTGCLTSK